MKLPACVRRLALLAALPLLFAGAAQAQDAPPPAAVEQLLAAKATWWEVPPPPDGAAAPAAPAEAGAVAAWDGWNWLVYPAVDLPDRGYTLVRSRPSGDDRLVLTNPQGVSDTQPRLSYDAARIVFVSDRDGNPELYTANIDGSGLTRLTHSPGRELMPVWSPDGARILFVSDRDGPFDLYTLPSQGGAWAKVTNDGAEDAFPNWSRDGKRIAWVRIDNGERRLWTMNADGSGPAALTGPISLLRNPLWSPDGTKLLLDYDATGDGLNEIGMIDAGGANLRRVENVQVPSFGRAVDVAAAAWAADGSRFYYTWQTWGIIDGKLRVADANIGLYCLNPEQTMCSSAGMLVNGMPPSADSQSADVLHPLTRVAPLPAYSRRGLIVLRVLGEDRGPSGLLAAGAEHSYPGEEEWSGAPGTQLARGVAYLPLFHAPWARFRSTSIDNAENREPPHADPLGDTSTTFYRLEVSGSLTDSRGRARPGDAVAALPPPVDVDLPDAAGRYVLRLDGASEGALDTTVDTMWMVLYADAVRPIVRLDGAELLGGGDFEGGSLDGWSTAGAVALVADRPELYGGRYSALLGPDCAGPCLPGFLRADPPGSAAAAGAATPQVSPDDQAKMLLDSEGGMHVFLPRGNVGLEYRRRTPDGRWQAPTLLMGDGSQHFDAAFDAAGNLHMVWGSADLRYRMRPAGGAWTTPVQFAQGDRPRLAVSQSGVARVIYDCIRETCGDSDYRLYYRAVNSAGPLGEEELLLDAPKPVESAPPAAVVAAGPGGVVHVLAWDRMAGALIHLSRRGGGWTSPAPVQGFGFDHHTFNLEISATVDPDGLLHLLAKGYHWTLSPQGLWTGPFAAASENFYTGMPASNSSALTLDSAGNVHLFGVEQGKLLHRVRARGRQWSEPSYLLLGDVNTYYINYVAAAGAANTFHIMYSTSYPQDEYQYASTAEEQAAAEHELRRTVRIPADAHQPTLSFLYSVAGSSTGESAFEASVLHGGEERALFSTTEPRPWTLGWADLSPWLGEEVELIFRVRQAAGDAPLRAYLDEVHVAEWRTPVIERVEPARLAAGAGGSITLHGANFIATPSVRLGGRALAGTELVSAVELRTTVPADLPPGVYSVSMANPRGLPRTLPNALRIGETLYLPAVMR